MGSLSTANYVMRAKDRVAAGHPRNVARLSSDGWGLHETAP